MLLLVLILVVIAFGLLVVALLTGSVLWAWVSVGVSVVAAVVLLIDWLQRRSAVKAGAAAPVSTPPSRPTPMVDLDPATEILPVVPTSERRGSDAGEASVDRTERVQDAQQTVVMPVVQPSGSSSRPSGAEATVTSSGGISSPSVTKPEAESFGSTASGDSADDVTRTTARPPGVASGDTVSISKDALPRASDRAPAAPEPALSDAGEPAEEKADAGTTDTTATDAPKTSLSKGDGTSPAGGSGEVAAPEPAEPSSSADMTEVVKLDRASERGDTDSDATTSVARGSAPAEAAPSGSDQTVVTSLAAVSGSRPEPVVAAPEPPAEGKGGARSDARVQDSTSDVEKTVTVAARTPKNVTGEDGTPAPPLVQSRPPADAAPDVEPATVDRSSPTEKVAGRPPARKDVDLFAPASEPAASEPAASEPPASEPAGSAAGAPPPELPPGPPGEAPEEQSDPIAAEIVSGLDDEVVVVDEQPRYHVPTCRALASTPVIPLPVREAVELGFTPCGWCSPERTLAGQHRTAAY